MLFSYIIRKVADKEGYFVDDLFCGHGIGDYLHCKPSIIHHKNNSPGFIEEGMVFTIEPALCLHKHTEVYLWEDQFTVTSKNNPSSQFEHMVYISPNGPELLTTSPFDL